MKNLYPQHNIVSTLLNWFILKIIHLQIIIDFLKLKNLYILQINVQSSIFNVRDSMDYDEIAVKKILENLKEDSKRVCYTEHFVEQFEKRNLPSLCLEELVENGNLVDINEIGNSMFKLRFHLNETEELYVIAKPFNLKNIILISALVKNNTVNDLSNSMLEFEGIYDKAYDLMELHDKHDYKTGKTVEMEDEFNMDFDLYGQPVAIEIFQASEKFKIKKKQMSSATLNGRIEITKDSIRVILKASFNNDSIKKRVVEKEIPNSYAIPPNVFHMMIDTDRQ